MALTPTQPAHDLMIARMPGTETIYVGVKKGGRVRLTRDQARRAAHDLLELADAEDASTN